MIQIVTVKLGIKCELVVYYDGGLKEIACQKKFLDGFFLVF